MPKTDYLENKVLNHLLGKAVWTPPSQVYVALFSAAPSDIGGGTELTGGSFARVAAPASVWNTASGTGSVANSATIAFGAAPSTMSNATHYGMFDAPTGGNLLRYKILPAPKPITIGDVPTFLPGTLSLTED